MDFNLLTTKRVFHLGQNDGIHNFVAFDLRGEKRLLVQFLGGELHSSAIWERLNPFVAHIVAEIKAFRHDPLIRRDP